MNDGRVQSSGTEPPVALERSSDEPRRLAGTLTFDATAKGGPRVEIEFNAPLLEEFEAAR